MIVNKFEEMKYMYKHEDFHTLTTNITLLGAGGSYNTSTNQTNVLAMVTGSGSGFIKADVIDNGNKHILATLSGCIDATLLPNTVMISSLPQPISGKPSNNKIDVKLYKCIAGETCTDPNNPSCTTTSMMSSITGKQIYTYDPTLPPAPVMILTPGNGQIAVTWTLPSTTLPIFGYQIGWNETIAFLPSNALSYTITGLNNGQTYTVNLTAITQSMTTNIVSQTSTPTSTYSQTLANISISPSTGSINLNGTMQLTATCTDTTGANMTCPTLTWQSDNTSAVTVDSSGLITGVGTGNANITANSGSITSNTSSINVVALNSISIYPVSVTMGLNSGKQLTATCSDNLGNNMTCPTLTWSSDNNTIASVDSTGMVVTNNFGTANITASSGTLTSNKSAITVSSIYTGYLYIATNPPGAEIYIDDVDQKSITPMIISNLSPATHLLKLSLPKYKVEIGIFDISSNQITSIYKELTKLSTVCQPFNSVPKAEIYIDDTDMLVKTPNSLCYIPIGTHTFRLDGTFAPKPNGTFDFASVPTKAKIFVDGNDTGKITPGRVSGILSGTHTFSIRGIVSITK